jgi:hypothetical protein
LEASPVARKLFVSAFTNIDTMTRELDRYYDSSWTDDYTSLRVVVHRSGRSDIVLISDSQKAFMLPWTIERDAKVVKTFDARISRALAALLPNGYPNAPRVEGGGLAAAALPGG